jgi:hypothetical protein
MDETLEHHGIKGMKWGVRRTPEQLGHRPSRSERRQIRQENAQRRRNSIAEQYRKDRRQEVKESNAAYKDSVNRAQQKLNKAKENSASDKKIQRLERKVTDAQIRAHVNKVRESEITKSTANYMKKPMKEKVKDPRFWETMAGYKKHEMSSYREADAKGYDSARKKYGDQAVSSLESRDAAKSLAVGAAVLAGYAAVSVASRSS